MSISSNSATASLLSQMNLIASSPYTRTTDPYTGKTSYVYNTPAPITIDPSVLFSSSSATTSGASTTTKSPTPPWSSNSSAPKGSALAQAVTNGAAFFNPANAQLDAPAGTHTQDYQSLFALYQGLNTLQTLAQEATATGVNSAQQAAYSKTFDKGMAQLQTYLASNAFTNINVSEGIAAAKVQSTVGATVETDNYTTKPLATGSLSTAVDAFQGPTAFSMQVKSLNGSSQAVNFDLSEMGSTTRSLSNVVNYLNSKLAAAGVITRFADVMNPGQPQTVQVNGAPVTVSTTANTYSLQIKGTPLETLTLSAANPTPAIYLTSTTGAPGKTTTTITPSTTGAPTVTTTTGASDVTQQLTKLDAGSDPVATSASDGQVFNQAIANSPTAVRATATGPDGSVYVLGDIAGKTDDGQIIKGTSDVALMKYDSAGKLLFTRTLGAANAANGYALSVSPDGSQVAVAGTTTGPLDSTDTLQGAKATSSFVSVYSSAGDEQWTQTRPSTASDTPTAVTFGSNGQVFVAGTTQSALLGGGGEVGGQDSYVMGYTGKQVTAANGTKSWTSSIAFTTQFGTTGQDTPTGVAVSGNSLYVAGTENGHAVVRSYTLNATGAPTLSATRDLGDLKGGEVAGVAVAADGSVIVAGATHNGALAGGTIGQAYAGGKAGFVADLSAGLTTQASDKLNYIAAPSDFTAKAMTLSNGQVYMTGQLAQAAKVGQTSGSAAYVAQVDPTSGAVGWSRTLQGTDGIDAPTGIAVSSTGASALDKLGLPSGTIAWGQSTALVADTSLRPGDQFQIKAGSGVAQTITIQPGDTFATLAATINRVSGYQASATTTTLNGKSVLKITPLTERNPIQLIAGGAGKDALKSLGLSPGELTLDATSTLPSGATTSTSSGAKSVLGLNLPATLSISTTAGAKAAQTSLSLAIAKVQNLYQDLSKPAKTTTGNQNPLSSTLSNYYSAQLANYQLALQRLGG